MTIDSRYCRKEFPVSVCLRTLFRYRRLGMWVALGNQKLGLIRRKKVKIFSQLHFSETKYNNYLSPHPYLHCPFASYIALMSDEAVGEKNCTWKLHLYCLTRREFAL